MSTQRRIYLDYNATAPLVPAARDAMVGAMAEVGNPSSVHAEGRRARDRVERARRQVAELVGRPREQIVFTSGGTEANWLGILALASAAERRGLPKVVATTKIEHPSLLAAVDILRTRGWGVVHVPVTGTAIGVLAVGLANHEIGSIIEQGLIDWARRQNALIHLDSVQAAGKLALSGWEADSLAVSAHKIGGPQGIGALAISIDEGLPLVEGGHQERGRRPGTENTLGIVGFGAAAASIHVADWVRVGQLGDRLERGLRHGGARIHGGGNHHEPWPGIGHGQSDVPGVSGRSRVGGTINAAFAGALGDSIVMALDLEGIAVSTGAACTSGSIQPSPVLLGLGMTSDQAREGVRFSLGRATTDDEIDQVIRVLPTIVERARRHR